MTILDTDEPWPIEWVFNPALGFYEEKPSRAVYMITRAIHRWLDTTGGSPSHLLIGYGRKGDFLRSPDIYYSMFSQDMKTFLGIKLVWCEGSKIELLGDLA